MPLGLIAQLLAAGLLVALGALLVAVGALTGLVPLAVGGWWTVRCCRRM